EAHRNTLLWCRCSGELPGWAGGAVRPTEAVKIPGVGCERTGLQLQCEIAVPAGRASEVATMLVKFASVATSAARFATSPPLSARTQSTASVADMSPAATPPNTISACAAKVSVADTRMTSSQPHIRGEAMFRSIRELMLRRIRASGN